MGPASNWLAEKLTFLKARLLHEEVEEELGGDRGWQPAQQIQGLEKTPRRGAGRDAKTGGPLLDVPFNHPKNIPLLIPAPSDLSVYESGQVWDLTAEIRSHLAKKKGKNLLLALTLGHCHWSDRAQGALERSEGIWKESHVCLIARAGDRLAKVYFRDIRLGELTLTVPTFPLVLRFVVDGNALHLQGLAMDPLGPDPSFSKVKGLLKGENQIPKGSDHFEVWVEKKGRRVSLAQDNCFKMPIPFDVFVPPDC